MVFIILSLHGPGVFVGMYDFHLFDFSGFRNGSVYVGAFPPREAVRDRSCWLGIRDKKE
jgi:hypothetical protein